MRAQNPATPPIPPRLPVQPAAAVVIEPLNRVRRYDPTTVSTYPFAGSLEYQAGKFATFIQQHANNVIPYECINHLLRDDFKKVSNASKNRFFFLPTKATDEQWKEAKQLLADVIAVKYANYPDPFGEFLHELANELAKHGASQDFKRPSPALYVTDDQKPKPPSSYPDPNDYKNRLRIPPRDSLVKAFSDFLGSTPEQVFGSSDPNHCAIEFGFITFYFNNMAQADKVAYTLRPLLNKIGRGIEVFQYHHGDTHAIVFPPSSLQTFLGKYLGYRTVSREATAVKSGISTVVPKFVSKAVPVLAEKKPGFPEVIRDYGHEQRARENGKVTEVSDQHPKHNEVKRDKAEQARNHLHYGRCYPSSQLVKSIHEALQPAGEDEIKKALEQTFETLLPSSQNKLSLIGSQNGFEKFSYNPMTEGHWTEMQAAIIFESVCSRLKKTHDTVDFLEKLRKDQQKTDLHNFLNPLDFRRTPAQRALPSDILRKRLAESVISPINGQIHYDEIAVPIQDALAANAVGIEGIRAELQCENKGAMLPFQYHTSIKLALVLSEQNKNDPFHPHPLGQDDKERTVKGTKAFLKKHGIGFQDRDLVHFLNRFPIAFGVLSTPTSGEEVVKGNIKAFLQPLANLPLLEKAGYQTTFIGRNLQIMDNFKKEFLQKIVELGQQYPDVALINNRQPIQEFLRAKEEELWKIYRQDISVFVSDKDRKTIFDMLDRHLADFAPQHAAAPVTPAPQQPPSTWTMRAANASEPAIPKGPAL